MAAAITSESRLAVLCTRRDVRIFTVHPPFGSTAGLEPAVRYDSSLASGYRRDGEVAATVIRPTG
ncbi:MAG TPA: hypothetical protein VGB64_09535 [Actinomycetota bacterium]